MFNFSPNIAINVRELDNAVSFYKNVLGITLANPHSGKECGVEMKAGPITFWIDGCTKEQEEQVGKVFFEFTVPELAQALNHLEKNGCKLGSETKGENFVGRMVTDPFGMRFHVYQKRP